MILFIIKEVPARGLIKVSHLTVKLSTLCAPVIAILNLIYLSGERSLSDRFWRSFVISEINTYQGIRLSFLVQLVARKCLCAYIRSLHFPVAPCASNPDAQYYGDILMNPKVSACCCQTSKRSHTHTPVTPHQHAQPFSPYTFTYSNIL